MTSNSVQADPLIIARTAVAEVTAILEHYRSIVRIQREIVRSMKLLLPALDLARLDDACRALAGQVKTQLPMLQKQLLELQAVIETRQARLCGLQESLDHQNRVVC